MKFCGWVGDSHHLHLRPFERNTTIFLEHCKFLASFSFTIQQNLWLNKCSNTKWTPNVPAYRRAHSDGNDTHSCETENYVIQTTFLTVSISSPKYSLFSMCVFVCAYKKPSCWPSSCSWALQMSIWTCGWALHTRRKLCSERWKNPFHGIYKSCRYFLVLTCNNQGSVLHIFVKGSKF